MSARIYESIFIAAPTLSEDAMERLIASFEDVITSNGGELKTTDKWGRRSLAYEIQKYREGIYTRFEFEGAGDTVKELERRFRLNDSVLKFLTVRIDWAQKLMAKGKERRQAKQQSRDKRKKAKQTA